MRNMSNTQDSISWYILAASSAIKGIRRGKHSTDHEKWANYSEAVIRGLVAEARA